MSETTALDLRLLRAIRRAPTHGYALARELAEEGPDRATVYRRVAALRRAGLVSSKSAPGSGAKRHALALTAAGEERLRAELRNAIALLMEAFHARAPRSRGGGGAIDAPVIFASGSRITGVEMRILAYLAKAHPRRVHLVVPPGSDPPRASTGIAVSEGTWTAIPFRDGYARTMFVNELPPARALAAATREWARVLSKGGSLNVIAPAPLPRGVDPFVDFLAELRDELHPDSAGAPETNVVTRALQRLFRDVDVRQQADQRIWTAKR